MYLNAVVVVSLTSVLGIVLCGGGDSDSDYGGQPPRKQRFISFETTDDNIRVDLDFSIPFLSIPIKRTLESTIGSSDVISNFPTVNINVAGAVLGGAVVLASTFILPFFIKTAAIERTGNRQYARFLESSEFQSDVLLANMNSFLTADRHLLGCLQRFVCWTAKNYPAVVTRASSTSNMLKDITSNAILSSLLNGTAIDAAVKVGTEGRNCTEAYSDCPISHHSMKLLMTSLAKFGKV